jgi:aminoacrylate hydrolase
MATMIAIDGGKLAYEEAGAGPPVVFIAGLGGHGAYWRAQVAAFRSDFRTVTFDHRGVGGSEGGPPYSVEQWAADTLRLMDRLHLDRVHLVAHSTGGAISQVLASSHLDRVATLVLGGTWARPDARFVQTFKFRRRVLLEMGSEAYEELGSALTLPVGRQAAAEPLRAARPTPPEIVAARIDALLTYDAGERTRRIRSPTLVIAAADDVLVPHQLSQVLADEIAGARMVMFERGGHHFPQTQVDAYNTLLFDHFRGGSSGGSRE